MGIKCPRTTPTKTGLLNVVPVHIGGVGRWPQRIVMRVFRADVAGSMHLLAVVTCVLRCCMLKRWV